MRDCADIYNRRRVLESVLSRLQNSNLTECNKQSLQKYYQRCLEEGLTPGRITKCLTVLMKFASWLNSDFEKAVKQDILELIQRLDSQNLSEWTKHDYKVIVKKFYRWLRGAEEYPEEVKWIRISWRKGNNILPEELLTQEEINRMAEVARTSRDKALVLVLYESGCRIGELLTLRIRNVQFDQYGAQLIVNGKTGMRRVRILASAPALSSWINLHPLRENPESFVWVSLGTRKRDQLLSYRGVCDLLRNLGLRAGIKKRIYPHLFRHSRATCLANVLTEAQMKQYFGWIQNSEMASVYVHLSGRDVDQALLKLNGIEPDEEKRENEFRVILCPRCKVKNSPTSKFCNSCGLCLEAKTAMQVDELRTQADMLMNELVKNPKVLDALLEGIRRLKGEQSDLPLGNEIISNGSGERPKKIQERQD